jgi:hypothetical protein
MSWNDTPAAQRRGSPPVAALLTWILPGAGHLYLGQVAFGIAAFLVVQGLFWAGLNLTDGMLLEYLEPDLRGPFAGALAPEVGNLGMLVYQTKHFGYGPGQPRVWPEHMHLGTWLTAASGILNACLVAHALIEASRRKDGARLRSPVLLVVLAWLVPGLGHVLQKRVLRGAILFVALVGLFALGTALCAGSNLDRERHFYYWAGQALLGAPAMLAEFVHGHALVRGEIPYVDCGLGMTCVAGLLNVLAMLDILNHAEAAENAANGAVSVPRPEAPVQAVTKAGSLA